MKEIVTRKPRRVDTFGQPLRAFFYWWREELVSLLPAALRQRLQYRERQLVVAISDGGGQLAECHHGQPESQLSFADNTRGLLSAEQQEKLARMRRRCGDKVVIELLYEHVLSLSFPLPLEAEKNLHEAVEYELVRHVPFTTEQIYFDYELLERRKEQKKLWVSVVVVPRKQVAPLLSMVRGWGLLPEVVTVSAEPDALGALCNLRRVNLLPSAEQGGGSGAVSLVTRLLMLSAAMLMLLVALFPLLMQQVQIEQLRAALGEVKEEAASVQSMRTELERVSAEAAYVDEQKQQLPEVLDVLNALTTRLPDDTWLERLEMKGARIRMQGLSMDASSLIELLENAPLLQNVTFDSPVVKDQRLERFRFQIVAELVGTVEP